MDKIPRIIICPIRKLPDLPMGDHQAAILSSSFPSERKIRVPCVRAVYEDIDRDIPGRSFSQEAAEKFASFIKAVGSGADVLYCCCDSGISRSSAVAAAAYRYFGLDDLEIWNDPQFSPNPLVYQRLCEALHLPVEDAELDLRIELSRRALSDAIRRNR